ncbi:MAG: GerMN domain-containing protein [Wujia sp.]
MKKILIIYILCIGIMCTACGSREKQVQVSPGTGESMVYIYYPEDNQVVRDEEQYQIKLPDSVSSSVEEVMSVLMQKLDSDLTYHTYMLDTNNNLSLEFALDRELAEEKLLLLDASVCQTLFQIDEIHDIDIKLLDIDGKELRDNYYMRDSFYFYGYDESGMNEQTITLYFSNKSGTALSLANVSVIEEENVTMEEKIVKLLISRGSIPANTKVNSVSISAGTCYLDLSHQFTSQISGVKGEVALYSVVNSITSLPGIKQVQLLIDGETKDSYRGIQGVCEPLKFNEDIIE